VASSDDGTSDDWIFVFTPKLEVVAVLYSGTKLLRTGSGLLSDFHLKSGGG
jgi:hypothetical protein